MCLIIVLQNSNGVVKLVDFGMYDEIEAQQTPSVRCKKYWSLERFQRGEINYATDIWACGMIILQFVLHRYPIDMMYANANDSHVLVDELRRLDVDQQLKDAKTLSPGTEFISLALTKDPEKRPSAEELITKCSWFSESDMNKYQQVRCC